MSEFAFADGVAGPRKQPTQGRARDTVAAILEATFQVLDDTGADGLTTTRVAEVAGVSVGTLYQYFPNRDALINALLADHLDSAIAEVVRECDAQIAAGAPLAVAIERVVRVFLGVKAERADNARILNKAFGPAMLDDRPLVRAAAERGHRAVASVLAAHEPYESALARARLGCDALEGMIRGALAAPETLGDLAWVDQVVRITLAGLAGAGGDR